jgi:formate hydrogenlyase subunit 6/NADH:ubiquinone oxidoreductase subunit I
MRPNFIYRFENWATNPFLTKLFYSQGFRIDASKCIGCDNCVRNCPTGSIKKIGENQRVWGRNCIICTMCKLSCPTDAISSPCSWLMFAPFYSYNIRKAVEKGAPYIEVPKKHR